MYFFGDDYEEEEYYTLLGVNPHYGGSSIKVEELKDPEITLIYSDGMKETIDLVQERSKENVGKD
jgi:hypothetical protein